MITFGSDPELMVVDGDKLKSAIGVVNGNIHNRIDVNGHQFYYDNVLAECAVKPGGSKREVIENFRECISLYADLVKPYQLKTQACGTFLESELSHPDARKVGCAAESCAYNICLQESPIKEIEESNVRSCGGHIHIGAEILVGDGAHPLIAVHMMDLFLGVTSIWLDKDPTSASRRALYGKASRYREKPYGIEYRSLGNFWLESPKMVGLIYDLSIFCVELVESNKSDQFCQFNEDEYYETFDANKAWTFPKYDYNTIKEGINNSDKDLLQDCFELAKNALPASLVSEMNKLIDRPQSEFYKNWGI